MSAMGVKIEQFDVPVCNSFKPKVLRDQLCYEVDPNKYINPEFKGETLKSGLTFLIDHNEDVQISLSEDSHTQTSGQNKSLVRSFSESVNDEQSQIYLGSIGMIHCSDYPSIPFYIFDNMQSLQNPQS